MLDGFYIKEIFCTVNQLFNYFEGFAYLSFFNSWLFACQFYVLNFLKNVQDDETTLSEEEKLERVDAIDPKDEVKS